MPSKEQREIQRKSRVKMREFDHVTPIQYRTNGKVEMNGQQNTNTINAMAKAGKEPRHIYQLLCANCHKIKTYKNQDYKFVEQHNAN